MKRPDTLKSKTIRVKVGCGSLYITLTTKEDQRYTEPPINEVFIEPSFKSNGEDDIQNYCCKSFLMPIARLITFIIRRETYEDRESYRADLIKQLKDHQCPKMSVAVHKSCVDAISRVLLCHYQGHRFKEGRCYICKQKENE